MSGTVGLKAVCCVRPFPLGRPNTPNVSRRAMLPKKPEEACCEGVRRVADEMIEWGEARVG
jgi:hypothetical protein